MKNWFKEIKNYIEDTVIAKFMLVGFVLSFMAAICMVNKLTDPSLNNYVKQVDAKLVEKFHHPSGFLFVMESVDTCKGKRFDLYVDGAHFVTDSIGDTLRISNVNRAKLGLETHGELRFKYFFLSLLAFLSTCICICFFIGCYGDYKREKEWKSLKLRI